MTKINKKEKGARGAWRMEDDDGNGFGTLFVENSVGFARSNYDVTIQTDSLLTSSR